MQIAEIQAHNRVNMQRLNHAEQMEFLKAIEAEETDTPCIYKCFRLYNECKYFICAYCADGKVLINGFNNRTRAKNIIKMWQREYKNIQARIIVIHVMEAEDVGQ